jgi:hypothetical protein
LHDTASSAMSSAMPRITTVMFCRFRTDSVYRTALFP